MSESDIGRKPLDHRVSDFLMRHRPSILDRGAMLGDDEVASAPSVTFYNLSTQVTPKNEDKNPKPSKSPGSSPEKRNANDGYSSDLDGGGSVKSRKGTPSESGTDDQTKKKRRKSASTKSLAKAGRKRGEKVDGANTGKKKTSFDIPGEQEVQETKKKKEPSDGAAIEKGSEKAKEKSFREDNNGNSIKKEDPEKANDGSDNKPESKNRKSSGGTDNNPESKNRKSSGGTDNNSESKNRKSSSGAKNGPSPKDDLNPKDDQNPKDSVKKSSPGENGTDPKSEGKKKLNVENSEGSGTKVSNAEADAVEGKKSKGKKESTKSEKKGKDSGGDGGDVDDSKKKGKKTDGEEEDSSKRKKKGKKGKESDINVEKSSQKVKTEKDEGPDGPDSKKKKKKKGKSFEADVGDARSKKKRSKGEGVEGEQPSEGSGSDRENTKRRKDSDGEDDRGDGRRKSSKKSKKDRKTIEAGGDGLATSDEKIKKAEPRKLIDVRGKSGEDDEIFQWLLDRESLKAPKLESYAVEDLLENLPEHQWLLVPSVKWVLFRESKEIERQYKLEAEAAARAAEELEHEGMEFVSIFARNEEVCQCPCKRQDPPPCVEKLTPEEECWKRYLEKEREEWRKMREAGREAQGEGGSETNLENDSWRRKNSSRKSESYEDPDEDAKEAEAEGPAKMEVEEHFAEMNGACWDELECMEDEAQVPTTELKETSRETEEEGEHDSTSYFKRNEVQSKGSCHCPCRTPPPTPIIQGEKSSPEAVCWTHLPSRGPGEMRWFASILVSAHTRRPKWIPPPEEYLRMKHRLLKEAAEKKVTEESGDSVPVVGKLDPEKVEHLLEEPVKPEEPVVVKSEEPVRPEEPLKEDPLKDPVNDEPMKNNRKKSGKTSESKRKSEVLKSETKKESRKKSSKNSMKGQK